MDQTKYAQKQRRNSLAVTQFDNLVNTPRTAPSDRALTRSRRTSLIRSAIPLIFLMAVREQRLLHNRCERWGRVLD
jgi:hypothetical protein